MIQAKNTDSRQLTQKEGHWKSPGLLRELGEAEEQAGGQGVGGIASRAAPGVSEAGNGEWAFGHCRHQESAVTNLGVVVVVVSAPDSISEREKEVRGSRWQHIHQIN